MVEASPTPPAGANLDHWSERADLAATFRWAARLNMHEAVTNHFSLAVNASGSGFLITPNQMPFSRIKASDLLLLDANNPDAPEAANAPDSTAWGLHAAIHRTCPQATRNAGGALGAAGLDIDDGKAIVGVIGHRDALGVGIKGRDHQHGARVFLTPDRHIRRNIAKYRRAHEPAGL